MGIAYNTSIVRDGLVLHLDAANVKSYPGSGTTWGDLSGVSSSGTITGGNITHSTNNNGYFNFPSGTTGDYVDLSANSYNNFTECTFLAWVRPSVNTGSFDGVIFNRYSGGVNGIAMSSNKVAYSWNNAANTWGFNSGLTAIITEWNMIVASISSTSAVLYLGNSNGFSSSTNSVSHSSSSMGDLNIGRDQESTAREFDGDISVGMMYNRALSTDEIKINFEALRGRYGL